MLRAFQFLHGCRLHGIFSENAAALTAAAAVDDVDVPAVAAAAAAEIQEVAGAFEAT